ncbi:MAG: hypothetical protein L3J67_13285 [Hyphomicrobiaceae bacterium]|nr:hypothetical protein [Hyphomicrobiaceae bacterium]
MTLLQTIIELTFTSIVLVIAGLALAAYTIAFYAVMIALDGCEICKWVRNRGAQSLLD